MSWKRDKFIVNSVAQPISLSGVGLHTGRECTINILPSDSGKIVFNRVDLGKSIEATYKNIVSNHRNSTIGYDGVNVETVEHIMSSFYMHSISSVTVEIDGPEVPIFDGSAKVYNDAFEKSGLKKIGEVSEDWYLDKELIYNDGNTYAKIKPYDGFLVNLTIEYPQEIIGTVTKHFEYDIDKYNDNIGNAKTFVLLSEILLLIDKGLIKGGSIDSAVVVRDVDVNDEQLNKISEYLNIDAKTILDKLVDNQKYKSQIFDSFTDEICSHKVLDLIGDLALLNKRVGFEISINKPGHFANGKIAKLIDENLKSRSI